MNAGSRVAQVRLELDMSQRGLAEAVTRLGYKISQTGIDKIEKRDTARPKCVKELAIALKVTERWLLSGRAPKALPQKDGPAPLPALEMPIINWVSAGQMTAADVSDAEIGRISTSGIDSRGDWIALRVVGDSMDRISPPDSVIMVNRNDKNLVPNALYVIDDGDGNATYKRYRTNPPRFEPVSTNINHTAIFPDNDPLIIGRVRRSILEM